MKRLWQKFGESKPKNYKGPKTLQELEKAIADFFHGKDDITDLDQRVLSGFSYKISYGASTQHRSVVVHTREGGTRLYIAACRKTGVPDRLIAESIFVLTDNHGYISLADVVVTKKPTDETQPVK